MYHDLYLVFVPQCRCNCLAKLNPGSKLGRYALSLDAGKKSSSRPVLIHASPRSCGGLKSLSGSFMAMLWKR